MTKLSYFVIKFKNKFVLRFGKKDLRKVAKWWKKEFLLLEKTNAYN
jgi:hypothetical protein